MKATIAPALRGIPLVMLKARVNFHDSLHLRLPRVWKTKVITSCTFARMANVPILDI